MRPSLLWAAASVALGVTLAACSGGPKSPTVPAAGSQRTTTAVPAGGQALSGQARSPKLRPTRSACASTAPRTSPTRC